jgi:hypothetical protein
MVFSDEAFALELDKTLHVGCSYAIASTLKEFGADDAGAAYLALLVGAAKEFTDSRFDWGDFSADVVGTALALLLPRIQIAW